MRVADDHIQIAPLDSLLQKPQRITRHADESRLAFLLQLLQRAVRFVEDVFVIVGELDVVREQNFDVIGPESLERRLEALARPFWSEVELRLVEPACLGADIHLLAPAAFERPTEKVFRGAPAVKGSGVHEIHARIDGGVNGVSGFLRRHWPELLTERRTTLAQNRDREAGFTERSIFHDDSQDFGEPRPQGRWVRRTSRPTHRPCGRGSPYNFTTLFSAIDFSAASIIFCAVMASSNVLSGF